MKTNKKLIFLLIALFVSIGLSAQFSGRARSVIITDTIHSEILNADRAFNIFLPQSYEANQDIEYPILYLLHGMNDTNQGWTTRGHLKDVMDQLVASGEVSEMIIVTPNAGGNVNAGDWNGYFNMPGWAYEDFFFQEFVPYIENTYRVIGDKQHRAIAGLSMGGGGATNYAQRHADMFCAVFAKSALMSIPGEGSAATPSPDDKMAMLNNSVIENSCIKFVEEADEATIEKLRTIQWFVDCGDDDFLLERNIEFTQAMRSAQIPFQFRIRDGGHTWEYWHSGLYTSLPFVSRTFGK